MSEPERPLDDAEHPADASDPLETFFAAGLREALQGATRPIGQQPSTMRWLASRIGKDLRLTLRPATSKVSSAASMSQIAADPATGTRATKYELLGEIGHGGMGTVLRGRDCDIGREVAVKLLHGRHCANPELIQRFVEEAQICGQLQHPGIVPVYDIGIDGGRPFFTMKLIDGHTLATLLHERKSDSGERLRFLRIFEQVCQTMAYAHARAVIHRDLKPGNIMVGRFGEVQVMDWGFAKVLDQTAHGVAPVRTSHESDSRVGSAFGTPAYMPPEQARGDILHSDQRSDVFALGAILCEILTGVPAYAGKDELVFANAQAGATQDAYSRLDVSDADQELIAIAKACLASDIEARPRSANVVAERIAIHLASAERRADAARFKIMTARRAQRLTSALAAALVLVLVVGGAGAYWLQRGNHELEVKNELLDLQRDALDKLARAKLSGTEESQWAAARQAAQQAIDLARRERVGAPLDAKLRALPDQIRREHADVRARAALERIRIPQNHCLTLGSASNREARRRHNGYGKAFADFGVNPLTEPLDSISARIRQSSIRVDLVAALDDWALATLTVGRWDKADSDGMRAQSRKLLALARAIDDDALRNRIRVTLSDDEPNPADLPHPTRDSVVQLPAATGLLLGKALRTLRENEAAEALLSSIQRENAGDFWLTFELAFTYETLSKPDWDRAVDHYRLAVALAPHLLPVKVHLAYALAKAGRTDLAEQMLSRALQKEPSDANAQNTFGLIRYEQRKLAEAKDKFRLAMTLDPDCSIACSNLGRTLYVLGRSQDAHHAMQDLRAKAGVMAAANKLFGDLHAEDRATLADAVDDYTEALAIQPDFGEAHYACALVLRRLARYDEAAKSLERAIFHRHASAEGWEEALRAELQALLGRERAIEASANSRATGFEAQLVPARRAYDRQRIAEAARLYVKSLSAASPTPQSWDAICVAVLAADRQGKDEGESTAAELAGWRRFAFERLSLELASLRAAAASDELGEQRRAEAHLRRWLREPDLQSVRERPRLAALPEAERNEWRLFWLEVRELLRQ